MRPPFLLILCLLATQTLVTNTSEAAPPWPENPFIRQQVEDALPKTTATSNGTAYAQSGTRGASYVALGLLWRNQKHDRATAIAILRELVKLQHTDGPGNAKHGVWRTRLNETKVDYNWREFVGCSLILTLEEFGDQLPTDLVQEIRQALLRAAQGAKQRNVGTGYTNIAIMSAFLMDYVGTHEHRDDLQSLARKNAAAIFESYYQHKTFDEYNSPTYYGVNFMALGMWRKHACWDSMRSMGAQMEADLWHDVGEFYHAEMRNMCGPFVRSYGMDMSEYVAITGIWIGMALGEQQLAPLPQGPGRKSEERSYSPVIAILKPVVPAEVLPRLAEFRGGPRALERVCSRGIVTAWIDKNLMMGAMQLERRWEQHFPATIHWKVGSEIGWLMMHGTTEHVAPAIVGQSLQIERTGESKDPMLFYVAAPRIDEEQVLGETWNLPGLTLQPIFSKGVTMQSVNKVDHPWWGECLEVKIQAPAKSTLILRPTASGQAIR
ncbi:hypothetical protein [Novipirellula artificiosorum]|uniref:Heparinase II/III-like protein n=1 Tax=Novipirellula artificiosorum TaxID=2528016 RepID=A0A5C6D7N4_9BACT|nr:hypothetical protein [Novipirellula artificiosorum]TWU32830.1 hypothetical protein Poly41_52070 [Novipirellula artificiosorum]